jgi:hypothetical protein
MCVWTDARRVWWNRQTTCKQYDSRRSANQYIIPTLPPLERAVSLDDLIGDIDDIESKIDDIDLDQSKDDIQSELDDIKAALEELKPAPTDGKVDLYIESHPILEGKSLEQFFNEKLANRTSGGDHIGYTLTKNNWYVISGVNVKGFEFYEKFFVFSDSQADWFIYFDFIYPHGNTKSMIRWSRQ